MRIYFRKILVAMLLRHSGNNIFKALIRTCPYNCKYSTREEDSFRLHQFSEKYLNKRLVRPLFIPYKVLHLFDEFMRFLLFDLVVNK